MFAFFGLGVQELLILAVLAVGGLATVAILVFVLRSTTGSGGRVAALEEENRRLRDELDRGKDRPV